jgi:uncharacterized membrane protein
MENTLGKIQNTIKDTMDETVDTKKVKEFVNKNVDTEKIKEFVNSKVDTEKVKKFVTNTETNMGDVERIASAAAGAGLVVYGISRKDTLGAILSIVGGIFAARGAVGHCMAYDALDIDHSDKKLGLQKMLSGEINVEKSVTINKPAAELYKFWRNFENLPQFMNHLELVKNTDPLYSHWKTKAPLGYSVEWDAEITNEVENRLIEWKSIEGSDIPNSGRVEFSETKDRGTVVKVTFQYEAPGGKLGSFFAKVFGENPATQVEDDLRRFKRLMEAGTNLKIVGQPSGSNEKAKKANA